jgi:hypothetical protein
MERSSSAADATQQATQPSRQPVDERPFHAALLQRRLRVKEVGDADHAVPASHGAHPTARIPRCR